MNLLSQFENIKTSTRMPIEHTNIGVFCNENALSEVVGYQTMCCFQATFGVTYILSPTDDNYSINKKQDIARRRLLQALYGEVQDKIITAQHLIMSGQYYGAVDVLEEVVKATRGGE
jgi:hypothetical protein